MQRIYERFHRYMATAIATTDLPAAFLAALTANESGGSPDTSCFEPEIYERLKFVVTGQAAAFGSISLEDLVSAFDQNFQGRDQKFQTWLTVSRPGPEAARIITKSEEEDLRAFATSWGLTQIMGYHVIGSRIALRDLVDPGSNYRHAVNLLTGFARHFGLSFGRDWEALFRCWNTGRPQGKTFDPEYVSKGLRRMNLYRQLASAEDDSDYENI
ncbi:MAG: hypothetical protein ACRD22_06620 [Terriglobia bacterium]